MKNEEFPVLPGIHCCQSELPAGAAVTPGSSSSGAFVEMMMSAECCPRPAAVVTAPPLKQSLYLPVPPFFVSVLLCRAPRAAGPTPSQGGLLFSCGAQSHSIPNLSPIPQHSQLHSIPNPQSHSVPAPFDSSSAHRDLGVPCATAPPVATNSGILCSPSWLE